MTSTTLSVRRPCHLSSESEESCHPPAKTLARFPPDLDVVPSMRHVKRSARRESLFIECRGTFGGNVCNVLCGETCICHIRLISYFRGVGPGRISIQRHKGRARPRIALRPCGSRTTLRRHVHCPLIFCPTYWQFLPQCSTAFVDRGSHYVANVQSSFS